MRSQVNKLRGTCNDHSVEHNSQLEKLRAEMQRAGRNYDAALEKFRSVIEQNMELENKFLKVNRRINTIEKETKDNFDSFQRFESVIQPMHSFKMIQETLQECLIDEQLNNFIDYAQLSMWPKLQLNLARYDQIAAGVEDSKLSPEEANEQMAQVQEVKI